MTDVAVKVGMTVPNLGTVMRRNPTLKRIKAVAEAIGIPPEELVKEQLGLETHEVMSYRDEILEKANSLFATLNAG